MISKDKQYRTCDGREVRIYATDCGEAEPIHGAIKCGQQWRYFIWNENGRYMKHQDSLSDLIEVKPRIKRTVWLNVYNDGWVSVFSSKQIGVTTMSEGNKLIACIKFDLDFEEGEGL